MQRPAVAPGAFLPGMVVLALAALPMLFVGLGAVGLLDPDEPFYAVPACEMLRSGSWLVPIFRGEPWFDKPIFFYWVVLAGFRLLGESEVAARLGSALAGFGGAVAVLSFGRRFASGRITALLAALVLLTSLEYALMARVAVTDMTLTLAITLVMLAAARYLEEGRTSQAALAGAAAGLALLTKGPVGALLPGVALLVYALLARRSDLVRRRALAAATAGALLTAGPWYLYMALRHRDLLVGTFLGQGNLGRFL
ncbi:MAG TPA: glycosyltransferase family 39 protein, partial [Candidatus Polarisedimenticolia bacterium]|nr:glycosyltransferase family 39 protein [Candidatus Polarisedimenticolia bacterium]